MLRFVFANPMQPLSKDPTTYSEFRDAFMDAIKEYNCYGAAKHSIRLQIDDASAVQMYGFKAFLPFVELKLVSHHI